MVSAAANTSFLSMDQAGSLALEYDLTVSRILSEAEALEYLSVAESDLPLTLCTDYAGSATVVGYTVVFEGEQPSHGVAICDTPEGERTVARSDEGSLLVSMTREEFCGREVQVESDGSFSA